MNNNKVFFTVTFSDWTFEEHFALVVLRSPLIPGAAKSREKQTSHCLEAQFMKAFVLKTIKL